MRISNLFPITVVFLILNGCSATAKRGELTKAVLANDPKLVRELLENKADVNENLGTDIDRITPIIVSMALGHDEVTRILLNQNPKQWETYRGYSPRDFTFHLHRGDSTPSPLLGPPFGPLSGPVPTSLPGGVK